MTIEQVAEWAPQYSLEIQRTIRYIGMKIIDEDKSTCDFENMGAMLCKPSQVPSHLLHLRWNYGGSTDGTDSNKGQTYGDYSNGILSFSASLPVFSFHLYIKVGLWISTELTEFSTRRLSLMKRERRIIKSWIHLSIPIHSSRHAGDWIIKVRAFTHNILFCIPKMKFYVMFSLIFRIFFMTYRYFLYFCYWIWYNHFQTLRNIRSVMLLL